MFDLKDRKTEAFLVAYVVALSAFAIFVSLNVPVSFDGGTHLLLSEFYGDMISNLPNIGLNVGKLYEFGTNYLIHYPKLTITYLPLYHLTVTPLLALSLEPVMAVLVSLIYFALTVAAICAVGKKLALNKKQVLIAVLVFTLSPAVFSYTYHITVDYASYFFCFLTMLLFLKAVESGKDFFYILSGISCFLVFFSRIFAVFPLIAISAYIIFFEKSGRLRKLLLVAVPFLVLFVPFFFVYNAVGGLDVSAAIIREAESMPWVDYSLSAPFYYIIEYAKQTYCLGLIVFAAAFLHLYRSYKAKILGKSDAFLLLWLAFTYLIVTYLQNPRYVSYLLVPLVFWSSTVLSKLNAKHLVVFLVIFSIVPLFDACTEMKEKGSLAPVGKEISEYLYVRGGNIGILSEGPVYSSVYLYHISTFDRNKIVFTYRPCFFDHFLNVSGDELLKEMGNNGIKSVLSVRGNDDGILAALKEHAHLENSFYAGNYTFDVYSVDLGNETAKKCNYICATGYYMCTDIASPFDVK